MGKTNLIDAIYYLCIGKSYFHHQDKYVLRHATDFFRLEGQFLKSEKKSKIEIKLSNKKEILKNGKRYDRIIDHVGAFPVVMITPRDIEIFYEGSAERRRYMDYSLAQVDKPYLKALSAYNKIIKQRNAALKQFAQYGRIDDALLQSYDQKLIPLANYIFEQRTKFIESIESIFERCYQSISSSSESCKINYLSKLTDKPFAELLSEASKKDLIIQRTSVGIHKDDIEFEMNGENIKHFGSQGQLKSFVLALKIAQYEWLKSHTDTRPIFLLDDIFDKLDEQRIKELLNLLSDEMYGQVFITDTKEKILTALFNELNLNYKCIKVNQGKLIQNETIK